VTDLGLGEPVEAIAGPVGGGTREVIQPGPSLIDADGTIDQSARCPGAGGGEGIVQPTDQRTEACTGTDRQVTTLEMDAGQPSASGVPVVTDAKHSIAGASAAGQRHGHALLGQRRQDPVVAPDSSRRSVPQLLDRIASALGRQPPVRVHQALGDPPAGQQPPQLKFGRDARRDRISQRAGRRRRELRHGPRPGATR
jgi:hypothetical protein